MVRIPKKIEKDYAFKLCNETKEVIESRGYNINFVINGGIISNGYSYNDIDPIIISNNPITDDDVPQRSLPYFMRKFQKLAIILFYMLTEIIVFHVIWA